MTLLSKTQLLNKITGNNRMNINSITTTITLEDVANSISESMKASDTLGAFNHVEIVSIDGEKVHLKLSRKGKVRARKTAKKASEAPVDSAPDGDTSDTNSVIDSDEDDEFASN